MATSATLENWQNLGFSQLQNTLDEQSSKLYESQEEGVASRKALATQTKAFKKLNDEEKLSEVRSLLKNYQSEIDSLTNRCKFAEQCFMDVYKSLALLPDPAPLLQAQQSELDQLKATRKQAEPNDEDSRLARELERQTLKVSQLEKQLRIKDQQITNQAQSKEQLQLKGDKSSTEANTSDINPSQQINLLETELSEHRLKLSQLQIELKDQTSLANKRLGETQHMSIELKSKQDYDQIKKELNDLKTQASAAELINEPNESASVEARRQIRSLELANSQLTQERNTLKQDLDQLRRVAGKLEDDLSAVQASDTFSTVSGWTAVPRGVGAATSIAGVGGNTGSTSGAGGSAVSGIILQQRDRYKKRMQELEEKLHSTETELEQNKKDHDTMKRESYKLYDRIRQLQATSGASVGASADNVTPTLYDTPVEQKLKELDLDRRCVGLSQWQSKLVEISARALVDPKFRLSGAGYIVAVHLVMVLGIVL